MEFVERIDQRKDRADGTNRFRTFLGLIAFAFAITLALVVGNRLTGEALAVLAGAVCGVGAAIPTSLIIVAISRRQREETYEESATVQHGVYPQGAYPPVVIVAPQGGQQQPYGWNGFPPSLSTQSQREFTVVGGAPMSKEVGENGRYF